MSKAKNAAQEALRRRKRLGITQVQTWRFSSIMQIRCEHCGKETDHRHLHDSPYGLLRLRIPREGAHMAGSERYECAECGHAIFAAEGTKRGLKFVLDK